jgi:ABC-type transport system involved in multi-copper enzyme maturation permease subunit
MIIGNPFAFPETWHSVAYFSSLFIFIPAIVIIMLITNEYSYKTNRQNIIDGWSRKDFMTGKLLDVIILSVLVTILYTVVCLGIGISNSSNAGAGKWDQAYYIGLFALQSFSQLSLAFLVGFLIRKSFMALAVFSFYFLIAEPIAVKVLKYKYHNEIGEFFPREISDRLLPVPQFFSKFDAEGYKASLAAVHNHVYYTLALIVFTWLFCFWQNNRRDL